MTIAVAALLAAAPALAQDLVITNARIIVGNGQVIERGSVVVRAGRIASVAAGAPASSGGQTINANGMTVMAGLIDAHRHIIADNADQWFKTRAAAAMPSVTTLWMPHAVSIIDRRSAAPSPVTARSAAGRSSGIAPPRKKDGS